MVAGVAIFFFFWLNHRLWPVRLTASASAASRDTGILQDLRLTAAGSGTRVRWLVDSGYVRQLVVSGSGTELDLPLPVSDCPKVAIALAATCVGGQLRTSSPLTLTWSSYQKFASANGRDVVSADLDIAPFIARPGVLGAEVTSTASTAPGYCFDYQNGVTVTLSTGGHPVPLEEQPSECFPNATGLRVLVGSPATGLPPATEFDDVEYLTIHAQAPAGILYGFAGQLELSPGPATVPVGPATLCSKTAPCGLHAEFNIDNASQSVTVTAKNATSVVTNDGQLVPSAWNRNSDKYGPVYGVIFTLFVITPLTAVIGILIDALKRWPGPRLRWLRRERSARKTTQPRRMR